jgi:hypothetical protein
MTNLARSCTARAIALTGLLLAACVLAGPMRALGATADAPAQAGRPTTPWLKRSSSARSAPTSARPTSTSRPHLEVEGHEQKRVPKATVNTSSKRDINTNFLTNRGKGAHSLRRMLAMTSVQLVPVVPVQHATMQHSFQANAGAGLWASPITVVFDRAGGIVRIVGEERSSARGSSARKRRERGRHKHRHHKHHRHAGSGSGASGGSGTGGGSGKSGSGSGGSGSGGSGSGSGGSGGSGSGSGGSGSGGSGSGGSGSGSGGSGGGGAGRTGSGAGRGTGSHSRGGSGSGSGSESGSGGEGSGSGGEGSGSGGEGSGSGGEGSGSGGEETHAGELKIGLIGFMGWGAGPSETIREQTGVKYTRLEPGVEGWGMAEQAVSDGITPYVLYNPGLHGMSSAAVAEGVKSFVPHMHTLGLTEMELGNEVYYNGSTPAEYAAQYRAAHEALAGTGITLIANAWIDTQKPNGEWSDWEDHGGWCVLFVEALGYVPDAWSFHPYGPMSANHFGSGANRQGWGTVPRMISYMKEDHIYAPLNITEVGQATYGGEAVSPPVTEAEQAADVRQYLTQAAEWGLASFYLYEAVNTAEGGYGLYSWPLKAKPSAAAFAETLADLEAESLAG